METSLTLALIVRSSPGVAVLPAWEERSHVPVKGGIHSSSLETYLQPGHTKSLLINSKRRSKSRSCWVLVTQRGRFSPPPSFSQPYTIVNTMMAALKHWSGFSEESRTPPPLNFVLNIAQVSTVWLRQRRNCLHPHPILRQEAKWLRVFPSLFLLEVEKLPFGHKRVSLWEHYTSKNTNSLV